MAGLWLRGNSSKCDQSWLSWVRKRVEKECDMFGLKLQSEGGLWFS